MARIFNIPGNLFFNVFLIIFAVIAMFLSLKLGFGSIKEPGPGIFSFFLASLILILNIIILVFQKGPSNHKSVFDQYAKKKFLLMIIPFIFWLFLTNIFGYILTTLITIYIFSKFAGLEGWRKPLIMSLGIGAFCYFLFDIYLYLDLPRGFLD